MNIILNKTGLAVLSAGLVIVGGVALAGGNNGQFHGDVSSHGSSHQETTDHVGGGHGTMGEHAHKKWQAPPAEYASLVSKDWDDTGAGLRGSNVYQQQCAVCHGADGKGTGPAAAGLAHPPADLTNNFHIAPGDGDGYLFWRVSEGGAVEPFLSMQSAMPAFKDVLTEQERWDVLVYVHQEYHVAFPTKAAPEIPPPIYRKPRKSHSESSGHSH